MTISILVRNPDARHKGCRILYRDIGDYLRREQKLGKLQEWGSISSIDDWQEIQPDRHHDWVGQRDETFASFYPVGSKEAKAGRVEEVIFGLYSRGFETARDAYIYNFSYEACANNARKMVRDYHNALKEYNESRNGSKDIDTIVKSHSAHVRWDRELKNNLQRRKEIIWSIDNIWTTQYRPFVKQNCYVEYLLVKRKGQLDSIFPTRTSNNLAICMPGVGSTKPFSALIVDCMLDLELVSKGQCFPRYHFIHTKARSLLNEAPSLERVDNISNTALAAFRSHYHDPAITKDAVFNYVYGVLHAPDFRARFANDLAKSLPRIPFAPDFQAFAQAGQALATLHLNYETGPQYPLT
ncbi:MAG TPA: damage-inducible protein, partial [Synechococcus sp. UBA8638]|nr:damage-inducible protein [Synechococcus sp. UBA8638]